MYRVRVHIAYQGSRGARAGLVWAKSGGGATPDGKWEEEDMSPNVVFCGTAVISKQGK